MPHLNQLIEKFGSKGFAVVGITSEGASDTRKFVQATQAKMIVAYEGGKLMSQYGFEGFPSSVLIDPNGIVVWKGHPSTLKESQIEPLLKSVRSSLELPGKYSAIVSLYEKSKYGESYQKMDAESKKPGLSEADAKALEAGKKLIEGFADGELAEARRLEEKDKDIFLACETFSRVAQQYAGMAQAKDALESAARIRGDASLKPEMDGGAKVMDAVKKMDAKSYQAAWKILSGVEKTFAGTGAATKAENLKKQIKDQDLYGFNPNCKDCQKLGKACNDDRLNAKW